MGPCAVRDESASRERAAAVLAGIAVATITPGPIRFAYFDTPLVGFAISCFIGIAAGLSSADDAGRRYLIRVAAAVQFAVFPAWFGLSVMHGFGSSQLVLERLGTFAINVATIAIWRRSLTAHCVLGGKTFSVSPSTLVCTAKLGLFLKF